MEKTYRDWNGQTLPLSDFATLGEYPIGEIVNLAPGHERIDSPGPYRILSNDGRHVYLIDVRTDNPISAISVSHPASYHWADYDARGDAIRDAFRAWVAGNPLDIGGGADAYRDAILENFTLVDESDDWSDAWVCIPLSIFDVIDGTGNGIDLRVIAEIAKQWRNGLDALTQGLATMSYKYGDHYSNMWGDHDGEPIVLGDDLCDNQCIARILDNQIQIAVTACGRKQRRTHQSYEQERARLAAERGE